MNLVLHTAPRRPLGAAVVVTYDPATGTSQITADGKTWTSPEPLGMVGACSTGSLFAWSGTARVTIRRARTVAARSAA